MPMTAPTAASSITNLQPARRSGLAAKAAIAAMPATAQEERHQLPRLRPMFMQHQFRDHAGEAGPRYQTG